MGSGVREVLAEAFEFVGLIAAADAQHEAGAAGEAVHHADFGEEARRLVERRDHHRRGEADALGFAGAARRHEQRRRADTVIGEVVFGEPCGREPQPVGVFHLLDMLAEHAFGRRAALA